MISQTEEALLRKIALAIWSLTSYTEEQFDAISTPDSELTKMQSNTMRAARSVLDALAGIES